MVSDNNISQSIEVIISALEKAIQELKELQTKIPITIQTNEAIQTMASDVKEIKRQLL